jgi:GWxTD domain-containing protein
MRNPLRTAALLLLACAAFAHAEEPYREPDPSEDRFFAAILSERDRADFEALSPEVRAEWKRRYWASVDPTPTTDENQREMEHQRRVLEAIRLFRDKNDRFVFDDRAGAYIRFGKPSRREYLEGEVVIHEGIRAPREFWLYDDMILWFEDRRLDGTYEEGLTTTTSSIGGIDQGLREDTGWQVDEELEFEEGFEQFLQIRNIEIDPTLAERYTNDGMHRWRTTPEINAYDYEGGQEFRFIFDVSYLAGSEGRTDMLIGFLVPLDKIAFETSEGRETARMQRQAALFTPDWTLVDRKVEDLVHARTPGTHRSSWIVTADSFSVDPGGYILALRIVDQASKNQGIFKTGLDVPSFEGDSIRIGDLVFAGSVARDERGEAAFLRGPYRIVPRPIRVFGPEEDMLIYFEIYHVGLDATGKGSYEIEYTLFGTKTERFASLFGGSAEGKLEPGIAQAFREQCQGPTARRYISIDASALPDDRYTLTVGVTDLAGGATDRATAQFVVKR